jgi:hypothetical protein
MHDLQSHLLGNWALRRTVSGGHRMSGRATFRLRDDGRLSYAEEGTTMLATGQQLPFTRSYLYAFADDVLDILFDEPAPRLFQEVRLVSGKDCWRGTGYHLCQSDAYRSQYVFERCGGFQMRHEVEGPRKSYVVETVFARTAA